MLRMEHWEREKPIFEKFIRLSPSFADSTISSWGQGPEPADVLCIDVGGRRIGVQLTEWLIEDQIRTRKQRECQEKSFLDAINSEAIERPENIHRVWLGVKSDLKLGSQDRVGFRDELLSLLHSIDASSPPLDLETYLPCFRHTDFSGYPLLKKYMDDLTIDLAIFPNLGAKSASGVRWIWFPDPGGFYPSMEAVDCLMGRVKAKCSRYSRGSDRKGLDELYLVVYYDSALIYNTTFEDEGFGLPEVAKLAAQIVASNPGPFRKIFLLYAVTPGERVLQLWPWTGGCPGP